ncbi:hypothetical protein VNO77_43581 [Canavalia gladiata]|uniref:Uncharacterized protein n=1 Tax=Canavalia gladiata TaxID=3824 RepID=A0AAN9PQ15_CANGL
MPTTRWIDVDYRIVQYDIICCCWCQLLAGTHCYTHLLFTVSSGLPLYWWVEKRAEHQSAIAILHRLKLDLTTHTV